jgi:hypothetical protein
VLAALFSAIRPRRGNAKCPRTARTSTGGVATALAGRRLKVIT